MTNLTKTLTLTTAALAIMVSPAMAREIKEVVGYKETVVMTVPAKDDAFVKIDRDADGLITFKEFQRAAMLDNEYEIFDRIDLNQDEVVSVDEYREFDKTKGSKVTESDGVDRVAVEGDDGYRVTNQSKYKTRYNFNRTMVTE